MHIKLFIRTKLDGVRHSGLFELSQDHCLIGRKRADLLLADQACSRQHALLFADSDGHLRLRDLDSSNGTYVNGQKVRDRILRVGDEIGIGDVRLTVVDFKARAETPRIERPVVSESSISTHGGVNVTSPGVDTTREVFHVLKPLASQEEASVSAADSVVAEDDPLPTAI